jgi:hypothetical protein
VRLHMLAQSLADIDLLAFNGQLHAGGSCYAKVVGERFM